VSPQGLCALLERLHRDFEPREIVITENGASYEDQLAADGVIADAARCDTCGGTFWQYARRARVAYRSMGILPGP
jgi:hypothetical protein